MKSCSTGGCKTKKTVLTILSLALGLGMLIFGLMKFGAPIEMQEWIGGAAHQAGLTFLSISTWFWIATIGEIIAGILLLIGCSKGKKAGALLTIIIMLVALNSTGWVDAKAYVFAAVALVVLFV